MCAGLPVVVSREVGCVPDLVKDGINGFTQAAGDVDGLARALRCLIEDEDLRRHQGRASLARIQHWGYTQCLQGNRSALSGLELRAPVVTPNQFPSKMRSSWRILGGLPRKNSPDMTMAPWRNSISLRCGEGRISLQQFRPYRLNSCWRMINGSALWRKFGLQLAMPSRENGFDACRWAARRCLFGAVKRAPKRQPDISHQWLIRSFFALESRSAQYCIK